MVNVYYQGKHLKTMKFEDVFDEFKISEIYEAAVFRNIVVLRKVLKGAKHDY